ncbi:MAG TPA: riboflavin synthase [Syntrophothermus lipocalidus]|nr:riboflavin synthase [Syntrophothermus lipocalidus]
MFTGIIEEVGTIREVRKSSFSCQLVIKAEQVLGDVKLGDSIAVNGVCLTVIDFDRDQFVADVMFETLKKTTLGYLRSGEKVNLERALRLSDRLGGHIVLGHVDGVGRIKEQTKVDISVVTRISASPDILRYVIPRGSIAVDGISLTVVEVWPDSFSVSLIPHTAEKTTLGFKKTGDYVNLEADIIGRYVERLSCSGDRSSKDGSVDIDFLREHGFAT